MEAPKIILARSNEQYVPIEEQETHLYVCKEGTETKCLIDTSLRRDITRLLKLPNFRAGKMVENKDGVIIYVEGQVPFKAFSLRGSAEWK